MIKESETKEDLQKSSKEYQKALEEDLDHLLKRSKEILIGAAVVGAGFWITYKIFKSLSSNKSEDSDPRASEPTQQSSEPGVMDVIKLAVMKELALFLLGIVKEKVTEYVQNIASEADEKDS